MKISNVFGSDAMALVMVVILLFVGIPMFIASLREWHTTTQPTTLPAKGLPQ